MKSIQLTSHVGSDGVLRLETPVGLAEKDVEVILIVSELAKQPTLKTNTWPDGFIDDTFGSVPDFPERSVQGDYTVRDSFE